MHQLIIIFGNKERMEGKSKDLTQDFLLIRHLRVINCNKRKLKAIYLIT